MANKTLTAILGIGAATIIAGTQSPAYAQDTIPSRVQKVIINKGMINPLTGKNEPANTNAINVNGPTKKEGPTLKEIVEQYEKEDRQKAAYDFWTNIVLPSADANVGYKRQGNYFDNNLSTKVEGLNHEGKARIKLGKSAGFGKDCFVDVEGEIFNGSGDYNIQEKEIIGSVGKECQDDTNKISTSIKAGYGIKEENESGKVIIFDYNRNRKGEGLVFEAECEFGNVAPGLSAKVKQKFYSGNENISFKNSTYGININDNGVARDNAISIAVNYNIRKSIEKNWPNSKLANLAKWLGIEINNEVEWNNQETHYGTDSNVFRDIGYTIGGNYALSMDNDNIEFLAGAKYKQNWMLYKEGNSTLNKKDEFTANLGVNVHEPALNSLIDGIRKMFSKKDDNYKNKGANKK